MARVGKKNKTKFKLHKELVFLLSAIVIMIAVTIILSIPSESKKTYDEINNAIYAYNATASTSYSTIDEDHVFKKANLGDIKSAIKKSGNGTEEDAKYVYVLYGSLNSAVILQYLSVIDNEAERREVSTVYWYSSEKVEKQEDLEDTKFVSEIEADQEVFNGESEDLVTVGVDPVDLLEYPALLVYKNGKLVFNSNTVEEDGSYNGWDIIISHAFANNF